MARNERRDHRMNNPDCESEAVSMERASRSGPSAVPYSFAALGVCVSSVAGIQVAHADSLDADSSDTGQGQTNYSGTLEQVVVPGVGSLLENKLPENLQDTPQSISVVSQKLIQEQAATRLEEALRNVPGITLNAGEGAARGDTVNLRGFSAFNDFFLDGIRDAAIYTRDSFNLDSLEVVKGPSAILFGRGSTGGAINQVSKAPMLTPLESATAVFGSNDLYRATTDSNVPLSGNAALRFNAMGESSEVAERDLVRNHRWGFAPTLAIGIGESNTLTIAYLHQQENNRPDSGIPFLDGRPAPVPRDAYYGLATDRVTTFDDIGTVRFRHEFGDDVALINTSRYANYQFSYLDTMPNYGGHPPAPGTPLSAIVTGRDAPGSSGLQTNFTNQTDLVLRFNTGPVKHTLVTGVEFSRQTLTLNRYVNPFNSDNDWIPLTPILDPNPYQPLPAIEPVSSQQNTDAHSTSVYATDTLSVGSYVDLVGGLRFDRFSADYHQVIYSSGAVLNLNHVDNLVSPRAAIVFKPWSTQSYYFSYGTSFDPSAEALALTTKTANLGPVKARTFEAGAKYSLIGGTLSATGAVFHTVVDNAQTNDPENPTVTTLNGNQRVNGGELGLSGYLTRQLEITAGYTYLDARTIESGTAAYVGKFLQNTARNAINLWTEYEFTDALEVGVGGNWLDHRFADYAESANIPGYVVWNAMASYKINKSWYLQLNGFNLANKLYYGGSYYTSVSENHVIPAPGRSVRLTIRFSL
jgi:catecholate siderophore receptor